ncbi:hypothetical protein ACP4OV_008076 [Aristida adscensionis]
MDAWIFLGDGGDSDGDSTVQVLDGSDTASEDGSESGFAIVRVGRGHAAPVREAPQAAVPQPPAPGFFKVLSYGETFAAAPSSDGGPGDVIGDVALAGHPATHEEDGEPATVAEHAATHEEDGEEPAAGEQDAVLCSSEAPPTTANSVPPCSPETTTLSHDKAIPELVSITNDDGAGSSSEEDEEGHVESDDDGEEDDHDVEESECDEDSDIDSSEAEDSDYDDEDTDYSDTEESSYDEDDDNTEESSYDEDDDDIDTEESSYDEDDDDIDTEESTDDEDYGTQSSYAEESGDVNVAYGNNAQLKATKSVCGNMPSYGAVDGDLDTVCTICPMCGDIDELSASKKHSPQFGCGCY